MGIAVTTFKINQKPEAVVADIAKLTEMYKESKHTLTQTR
jgi:hypothetical protein